MRPTSELLERHRGVLSSDAFRWKGDACVFEFELSSSAGAERWLVDATEERASLRPIGPEAPRPELAFGARTEDVAAHIRGELDLFADAASPPWQLWCGRDSSGPTTPAGRRLLAASARILEALAVSEQCRPEFRGSLLETIYLRWSSPGEDGIDVPMGSWSIPYYAGDLLYDLVVRRELHATLEIGLAHGVSAMFLGRAHAEKGAGRHVAIDPCQSTLFRGCGLRNLRDAGLSEIVDVLEQPNHAALPELLPSSKGQFQLVFIDGLHLMDHVLLDFMYADLLLGVGGFVVFDDSHAPAVDAALRYILRNRFDSYGRAEAWCRGRLTVLEKKAEDVRVQKYGEMFHKA